MIVPEDLLTDLREFLEGQQDINGNGGPNEAMQLLTRLAHECSAEPVWAQEATGKYKFRFEGRTYYTDQRRMTVAQMLFITDGRTEGHVFQQDHDSQPRRYLDHGDKIDMTCEPWLFIDLPARM